MTNSKTLILGLGNPILSDDGIGLVVADRIRHRMSREGEDGEISVLATPVVGIGLLDLIVGYQRLFLIDAFLGEGAWAGELRILESSDPDLQHFSSHGFDLLQTLKVGKELNLPVPDLRGIYGIAIRPDPPFGKDLSAEMRQKADALAEQIITHILSVNNSD